MPRRALTIAGHTRTQHRAEARALLHSVLCEIAGGAIRDAFPDDLRTLSQRLHDLIDHAAFHLDLADPRVIFDEDIIAPHDLRLHEQYHSADRYAS